jgi:GntR family transcriptional regulator
MVPISRKNPIPLYLQLRDLIIEKIENGEWMPGDTIPTEMELQTRYDLSRTTVRQALQELVSNGYLDRIQGKGTYVAEPKLQPIRPDLTGFTQDMSEKGHLVTSIVLNLELVVPNEKIRRLFNLNKEEEVLELERIRLVDGLAIGYHKVYLNVSIIPGIDLSSYDFSKKSLYISLIEQGVEFGESDEDVEASLADDYYAKTLNIHPGAPILKLNRFTRLEDGRPLEFSYMVYRGDKYKYSIKLK